MNPSNGNSLISLFCREPYRFFFPLGILIGLGGVGHWLAYGLGWMEEYSGIVHASVQIQGYMSCFVFGFLLTAIPKFASAPPASPREFLGFAGSLLGVWVSLIFSSILFANLFFVALLVQFLLFAARRFANKRKAAPDPRALPRADPPVEFVWLPIAMLIGIIASTLMFLGRLEWISGTWAQVGAQMMKQGFLLAIVVGVGGFMAPRLMGRTEIIPKEEVNHPERKQVRRQKTRMLYLALAALLLVSFGVESAGQTRLAFLMRALIATTVFVRNKAWPFWPRMRDDYVKLLWLSVGFVICGYWGAFLFPDAFKAMLHLVFLGGYSLMTFAVGTMVIYSHGGRGSALKEPLWAVRVVGVGMLGAVLFRVGAIFFAEHYFLMLGISSGIWLAASVFWILSMIPVLRQVPDPEAFDRAHEEAKARVRECR